MHTMQVSNDLYNVISIFAERDSISLTRVLKKAMVAYAEAREDEEDYQAAVKAIENDDGSRISLEEIERKYGLED